MKRHVETPPALLYKIGRVITGLWCNWLLIYDKVSLIAYQMSPWWPSLGPLSWWLIVKSSPRNSFEDQTPINFIYGCPIFKWVAENWLYVKVHPEMIARHDPWWRHQMGTFSASLAICAGKFPGHRWITRTQASDRELRCFLWSVPQWTVE